MIRFILHPSSFILLFLLCGCVPDHHSSGRIVRIQREEHDVAFLLEERDIRFFPDSLHLVVCKGNDLVCPVLRETSAGDSVKIVWIPYFDGKRWIRDIAILDNPRP